MAYGIHHLSDDDLTLLFEGIYKAPIGFALFALAGTDTKNSPLILKYINELGAKAVQRSPEALVDKPLSEAIPEAVGGPFDLGIRETFATGKPNEVIIHDGVEEGQLTTYRLKMLPLAQGLVLSTLIEVTNETILEREYRIERRTNLASRAYFDDVLHNSLQTHIERGVPVGILYIDLDKFKYVNDTYGHICGDELLTNLAQRLRSLQPQPLLIARWGGDEFAVITEWDREKNLEFAQSVLDEVAQPFLWGEQVIHIDMSVGVLTLPADQNAHVRQLMIAVDKAMYDAKHQGGGKIVEAPGIYDQAAMWHS